jgi:hypothetical protein
VPPRRKSAALPPPLTDADVASLRSKVTGGEKPRVIVRTASAAVPAGTRGNVVRVGSPADDEFIVVRLGRDEVPFAPTELALSVRPRGQDAEPPPPAKAAKPARGSRADAAAKPAPSAKPARPARATRAAAPTKPATSPAGTGTRAGRAATAATARRIGKGSRRSAQPLTVTLRFNDGGWTVEAQRGARRLARASAVRPGAVKAFADLVDEAAVRDALTETVESCRAVVEERAQKLRAELQATEATLKEYEARRR